MNALSLFNGISGLHCALDRAGIKANTVYYSEIDKYANQVTQHHYPEDVAVGDVTKWQEWDLDWSSIDLVAGGSPCQGFSLAGKQAGTKAVLNGVEVLVSDRETYLDMKEKGADFLSQSHLFWEYILILDHIRAHNPNVKFLLENVKMKKELLAMIDDAIGVKSVVINSALVSAQNRVRHYWCNWEVTQPEDKGILLRDVLEGGMQAQGGAIRGRYNADGTTSQKLECNGLEKTNTLTTVQKDNVVIFGGIEQRHRGKNNGGIHTEKSPTLTANSWEQNHRLIYRPCELRENSEPSKDNLHHIADATDIKGMDCIKRVYGQDGKAPTLTTMGGGHREPKVLVNESATAKGKAYTLTASYGGAVAWNSCERKQRTMVPVQQSEEVAPNIYNGVLYRKLTPLECERLQTLPDNWTSCVSNTQRYKSIGNGWTIDVIAHILRCMA